MEKVYVYESFLCLGFLAKLFYIQEKLEDDQVIK